MTKPAGKPKRRLLNIGPGLIIALALSIFIGAKWFSTEKQMRAVDSAPPMVERHTVSLSGEENAGPTPEVGFILDRAEKLGLTADQIAEVRRLSSDWKKTYGPRIAEANAAATKAQEYLANAKGNRSTPVAHIQVEAGSLIALSREISAARRSYWDRAVNILTAGQRKTLQNEREKAWIARNR